MKMFFNLILPHFSKSFKKRQNALTDFGILVRDAYESYRLNTLDGREKAMETMRNEVRRLMDMRPMQFSSTITAIHNIVRNFSDLFHSFFKLYYKIISFCNQNSHEVSTSNTLSDFLTPCRNIAAGLYSKGVDKCKTCSVKSTAVNNIHSPYPKFLLFHDTTGITMSQKTKSPTGPFPYTFNFKDDKHNISKEYAMHGKIYATTKEGSHFYTVCKINTGKTTFIGKIDNYQSNPKIQVITKWEAEFEDIFMKNTGATTHFPVVVCYKLNDREKEREKKTMTISQNKLIEIEKILSHIIKQRLFIYYFCEILP
jgi:hypothetical protein